MTRSNIQRVFRDEASKLGVKITGQWSDHRKTLPQLIKYRVVCDQDTINLIGQRVYGRCGANFTVSDPAGYWHRGISKYISFV